MIFLIGLACLAGALVAHRASSNAVRWTRWPAAAAGLTLFALWLAGDDVARYRFTLLGLRFRVATAAGAPVDDGLRIGGDYDEADLYVDGAGDADAAVLRAVGDSVVRAIEASALPDARAVVLIEHDRLLGRDRLEVLGAVPLEVGDTVRIAGRGGPHALVVGTVPDSISILGMNIGLPWVRMHTLTDVSAQPGDNPPVALPGVERSWPAQWFPRRPSVRQRTYPLADVLHLTGRVGSAGMPALSSFLFYDDGRLALADLDSEVEVSGRGPEPALVWSREADSRRILVAGLPLRDYPDPDLTLPERYGVRPIRSFRLSMHGGWLDAALTAPEIRMLDRATLEALRLGATPSEGERAFYRIRLSPSSNTRVRQAIVFGVPSRRFAASGQAVFLLPTDPSESTFRVLTPSGTARWESGRPLALGGPDRAVLLRVDGQAASAAFWAVHLLALLLAVAVFYWVPMSRRVFALALAAFGIVIVRLLMGLSAHLAFPYVQEAQQLGLWLLPFVPWAVAVAGRVGARAATTSRDDRRRWWFHAVFAFAMAVLASVLFVQAPAKQIVLTALPVLVLAALAAPVNWGRDVVDLVRRGWIMLRGRLSITIRRTLRRLRGRDALANGLLLGLAFFAGRVLLDLLGAREQIVVAGTRLGLSVLYTPLSIFALAVLMHRRAGRLVAAPDVVAARREAAGALLHIGLFLLFAFVLVGFWISDFGIVFTTMPGALILLALFAARAVPRSLYGRAALVAATLPLIIFGLIQVSPTLLHPGLEGDLQRVEARMAEWNRNELLLLERGDPQALELIGQRRSEALAVMRETMRSYTRGNLSGRGFLNGRVTSELQRTATREHAVSALLAAQWGLMGVLGLVFMLLAALVPLYGLLPGGPPGREHRHEGSTELGRQPGLDPGRERGREPKREHRRWTVRTIVPVALGLLALAVVLPAPYDFITVWILFAAVEVAVLAPAFGFDPARWGGDPPAGRGPDDPAGRSGAAPADRGGDPQVRRSDSDTLATPSKAPRLSTLTAALFLSTFVFAGLYMVLANYGLVLFTGKNVYLLGLDSVSDALEALLLLGGAAMALAVPRRVTAPTPEREEVPA